MKGFLESELKLFRGTQSLVRAVHIKSLVKAWVFLLSLALVVELILAARRKFIFRVKHDIQFLLYVMYRD